MRDILRRALVPSRSFRKWRSSRQDKRRRKRFIRLMRKGAKVVFENLNDKNLTSFVVGWACSLNVSDEVGGELTVGMVMWFNDFCESSGQRRDASTTIKPPRWSIKKGLGPQAALIVTRLVEDCIGQQRIKFEAECRDRGELAVDTRRFQTDSARGWR